MTPGTNTGLLLLLRHMHNTGTDTYKAAEILRKNGLVAIPTETVYGLAANAFSDEAVLKIYKAKNRPRFNPLILHVASADSIAPLVTFIPDAAHALMERFMPGPLTLLLPKSALVSDLVTAGSDRVAVRIPDHSLTLKLLHQLNFPLAAPSANPSGYISPTSAKHVSDQLGDRVDYILDGGPCPVGLESTIIGFDVRGNPLLYRPGGLSLEQITACCGITPEPVNATTTTDAPGMLASHYAPGARLVLGNITDLLATYAGKKIGILQFSGTPLFASKAITKVLSPTGNTDEAARNFFAYLRYLDDQHPDIILAEPIPDGGLGVALNDRLMRAAADRSGNTV